MKNSKIFLVAGDADSLTQMTETTYVTEDVLQSFLARYPDLLPGDQINPDNPRRWLLVTREMGVPGDETEAGRWSLDHLFLDQEGIPTFVECKRSTDTRARREVVAQMLDYAANGVEYWEVDSVRQAAVETHGDALGDKIADLIGTDGEEAVENFWKDVERNLHSHVIRLIFVADELPKELRQLIEFLNEQMTDVEVLGVEIKQYAQSNSKQTALVPRVIGATETARAAKETLSGTKHRTNRQELLSKCATAAADFFEYMIDTAEARGHLVSWGEVGFSVRAHLPDGRLASFAYGYPKSGSWPSESFDFYFAQLPMTGDTAQALRKQLLALGVFVESGEKTLCVWLNDSTLPRMKEVYDFILRKMDELLKTQQ
jgi:hypothetical protein